MISVCTLHRPLSVAIIKNKHDEISSVYAESSCKVSHFCCTLSKIWMYQQTSINVPTIKFHENLYGGIHCFIKIHGWTTACLNYWETWFCDLSIMVCQGSSQDTQDSFSNNGLKVTRNSCKTGHRGHKVWCLDNYLGTHMKSVD